MLLAYIFKHFYVFYCRICSCCKHTKHMLHFSLADSVCIIQYSVGAYCLLQSEAIVCWNGLNLILTQTPIASSNQYTHSRTLTFLRLFMLIINVQKDVLMFFFYLQVNVLTSMIIITRPLRQVRQLVIWIILEPAELSGSTKANYEVWFYLIILRVRTSTKGTIGPGRRPLAYLLYCRSLW